MASSAYRRRPQIRPGAVWEDKILDPRDGRPIHLRRLFSDRCRAVSELDPKTLVQQPAASEQPVDRRHRAGGELAGHGHRPHRVRRCDDDPPLEAASATVASRPIASPTASRILTSPKDPPSRVLPSTHDGIAAEESAAEGDPPDGHSERMRHREGSEGDHGD
jgi:hypothetical protein